MSFPPGTEMFQFPGFAQCTLFYSGHCTVIPYEPEYRPKPVIKFTDHKGGFPHSEIFGSKGARASPKLIAACHVLHRLSVPRHPSEALMRLIVLSKTHAWGRICRPRYETRTNAHTCALYLSDNIMMSSRIPLSGKPFHLRCHLTFRGGLACPRRKPVSFTIARVLRTWWSQTGSNRRPHACKARALPTELWPLTGCRHSDHKSAGTQGIGGPRRTRTADLTLIRRVL
jgi:hypothetical protein